MKASFLISISLLFLYSPSLFAQNSVPPDSAKLVATQMAERDLWVDHIFWIRSVVIARSDKNAKAETEADKQVVTNAKKLADVIEPFYGKPASEKLFKLLGEHYGAVKDYLNATIPKINSEKQKAATDKITTNAAEISEFLSGANPNLPKDTLMSLLAAHGGHHIAQINEIQKRNFSAESKTWEDMKQHMYVISDALVNGIAKQFPKKF